MSLLAFYYSEGKTNTDAAQHISRRLKTTYRTSRPQDAISFDFSCRLLLIDIHSSFVKNANHQINQIHTNSLVFFFWSPRNIPLFRCLLVSHYVFTIKDYQYMFALVNTAQTNKTKKNSNTSVAICRLYIVIR